MSTTATAIRPSKLPALAACACYESQDEAGAAAERGTLHHSILEAWLRDGKAPEEARGLNDEDYTGLMWAENYIRLIAAGEPLELEQRLGFYADEADFEPLFEGTQDVGCTGHLFDLKTGELYDYEYQMAAYAAMRCQRDKCKSITVHILYSKYKQKETYTIERDYAEYVVHTVLQAVADPERKPKPNKFCDWCAKSATCPELIHAAQTVAEHREDWSLESFHASEITQPEQMAKALKMAKFLKAWCEGVEHHAKDMVNKSGVLIPGWKLQRRQGNRTISDAVKAFNLSQMEPVKFIACCTAKVGELEKAMGKDQFNSALETVLKRGPESAFFVEEKEK